MFSDYIKNIALFIIFSSLVGMVIPSKKFKDYINLVLGLILIFIMVQPIQSILGGISKGVDINEILGGQNYDDAPSYDSLMHKMLEQAFSEQVRSHIGLLFAETGYQMADLAVENEADTIKYISIKLRTENSQSSKQSTGDNNVKDGVIHILPIDDIVVANVDGGSFHSTDNIGENAETVEITAVVNEICSFYNLERSNIYIKIID